MDILIKGLELPKEKYIRVEIHHDGTMYVQKSGYYSFYVESQDKAIELPPHGELISRGGALFQLQAEALGISPNDKDFEGIKKGLLIARKIIIEAPVIVEASNGTDN